MRSFRWRWSAALVCATATLVAGPAAAVADPAVAGGAVAVSAGVPAKLAAFYQQRVTWSPCGGADEADLQCAALTVPANYRAPRAGSITVTISRLPAADPSRRRGILLLNPGGPGGSGIDLPLTLRDRPIAQVYDLVGFDPRGFGRSTPVACEVPPEIGALSSRPTDAELPLWTAAARAAEAGCERSAGGLRPFVNTPNTARDMDVIRGVLGEEKINYLGFSYGTYLGAVYGSLFPHNLDRSVLDSSVNPDGIWRDSFAADAVATRANVDEWAEWVGQRSATFGLGSSGAEVFATSEALAARLAEHPITLPEDPTVFDRTLYDSLLGALTRDRTLWELTAAIVLLLRQLADGEAPPDPDRATDLGQTLQRLAELDIAPTDTPIGLYSTVVCEADWPTDPQAYYADMRVYRDRYPFGIGVIGVAPTMCAFRNFTPPDPLTRLRRAYPAGLVVQAEGDIQTPYECGPVMASRLDEPLVSVADDGRHGQYLYNACVQDLVDRYLLDGVLPGTRVTCPGAPRPDVPPDPIGAATPQVSAPSPLAVLDRLIQRKLLRKVVL